MTIERRLRASSKTIQARVAVRPIPEPHLTTDQEVTPMTLSSPRVRWILAAAAAAIVVVALLVRAGSEQTTDVIDDAESTTTTTAPTTTTSAPDVCIETRTAPGQTTFQEVCESDGIAFLDGRPLAFVDIDLAVADGDCDGLQSIALEARDEMLEHADQYPGPVVQLLIHSITRRTSAVDTYAIEQGVIQGCTWAIEDNDNRRGGQYALDLSGE